MVVSVQVEQNMYISLFHGVIVLCGRLQMVGSGGREEHVVLKHFQDGCRLVLCVSVLVSCAAGNCEDKLSIFPGEVVNVRVT